MVQAPWRYTALKRSVARRPLRRHNRATLPAPGFFNTPIDPSCQADRAHALELSRCDQPFAERTPALDPNGAPVRLRSSRGLLRCALGGLPGTQPATAAHGARGRNAQHGCQAAPAEV